MSNQLQLIRHNDINNLTVILITIETKRTELLLISHPGQDYQLNLYQLTSKNPFGYKLGLKSIFHIARLCNIYYVKREYIHEKFT